jgi:hypothetical protein
VLLELESTRPSAESPEADASAPPPDPEDDPVARGPESSPDEPSPDEDPQAPATPAATARTTRDRAFMEFSFGAGASDGARSFGQ